MNRAASKIPELPLDDDARAWREMPFVDKEGKWSPAKITAAKGSSNDYSAQWAVGEFYAASLIGYLRHHGGDDAGFRLPTLMDEITGLKLDTIARGLLMGLAQYIATGRINIAVDFSMVPYELAARMKPQVVIAPEEEETPAG
jgi:hypothetical protein